MKNWDSVKLFNLPNIIQLASDNSQGLPLQVRIYTFKLINTSAYAKKTESPTVVNAEKGN